MPTDHPPNRHGGLCLNGHLPLDNEFEREDLSVNLACVNDSEILVATIDEL